jgi:hypothetical protein
MPKNKNQRKTRRRKSADIEKPSAPPKSLKTKRNTNKTAQILPVEGVGGGHGYRRGWRNSGVLQVCDLDDSEQDRLQK